MHHVLSLRLNEFLCQHFSNCLSTVILGWLADDQFLNLGRRPVLVVLLKWKSFYLELCFTLSWASSYWIVVSNFSVLGVFPSCTVVEKKECNNNYFNYINNYQTITLFLPWGNLKLHQWSGRAYILIVDFFPLTLRRTPLLWWLCRALLLLAWRGAWDKLLLRGRESSVGERRRVWVQKSCGGDGCSSDQQGEHWL